MFEHTKVVQSAVGGGHDRAEIFAGRQRTILLVADGAGGMSGATRAVNLVVDLVRAVCDRHEAPIGSAGLAQLLERFDELLYSDARAGESTAVLVEVREGSLSGASVGDSGAWLVHDGGRIDLTARQHRKWRLGSGRAAPVTFGPIPFAGTLLVATDGLFECAPPEDVARAVSEMPLSDIAGTLVEGVRVPGGSLRDDVGLVLCRPRAPLRAQSWRAISGRLANDAKAR